MANDAAKIQDSDALDRQVEAMARPGSDAAAGSTASLDAQLDDLLASAPEPDQTLGSLDRQLSALTAELLEGDFADSNDETTTPAATAEVREPPAVEAAAGDSVAPVKQTTSANVQPSVPERADVGSRLGPHAAAEDAAPVSTQAEHAPATPAANRGAEHDDIGAAAPSMAMPPAPPSKLDGDMSLEEQMAALGADLLDGDFESVSGDVVGSTAEARAEASKPPVNAAPAGAPSQATGPEEAAGAPAPTEASSAPSAVAPVMTSASTGAPVESVAAAPVTASPGASTSGASSPAAPGAGKPTASAPSEPVAAPAAASSPSGAAAGVSDAAAPAPTPPKKQGPPLHTRVWGVLRRSARRAEPAARKAAALASKPLEGRPPVIRQSIGWLAIWTAFLAMCAIMASLMFRPGKAPETDAEPHALQAPDEPAPEPAPRAGENLRGRPIPPP